MAVGMRDSMVFVLDSIVVNQLAMIHKNVGMAGRHALACEV
jgi:hypothetical protein